MIGQLDLFADLAPTAFTDDREAWVARFTRTPWVTPYDCGLGPAGTVINGWECPACGKVEVNEFLLNVNHGYDPSIAGRMAWVIGEFGETCTRQLLLASQVRAAARKAAA